MRGATEPPPLRAAAATGVLWTVTQAWGSRLMTIVVFAVLGRQLDASAFGVMAMAVAVVEFGRLLVDQGFSRNIVQRQDVDDGHLDTAFWTALLTGIALTALAVLLSPVVAAGFDEPDLTSVLRVLSLSFVVTSFATTQTAVLNRRLQFRSLAVRQLVAVAAGGIVGIGIALAGGGVWALVAQNLTQAAVAAAVLWQVSPWRPGRRVSWAHFREMLGFGSATLAIELVGYFARRGDDIMIGAFLGTAALGFFNVAFRILQILMEIFTSTINAVAFPVFSRLQGDPARIRRALHLATRISSALAFPAFLGLAVFAPEFIRLMFGPDWEPSIDVLQIIALVGVLRSVTYFNRSLLLGLGKATWELGWVTFYVATKVAAFAIGQRWGLVGVAWAIVIHGYVLSPAGLWLINHATPLHPATYVRQLLAPLGAALVMVAVTFPLRHLVIGDLPDVVVLGVVATVGAVAYGGTLAVVAPALVAELLQEARRVLPGRSPRGAPT